MQARLREHWQQVYGAQNVTVAMISGDRLPKQRKMVQKHFGSLPRAPVTATDLASAGLPFEGVVPQTPPACSPSACRTRTYVARNGLQFTSHALWCAVRAALWRGPWRSCHTHPAACCRAQRVRTARVAGQHAQRDDHVAVAAAARRRDAPRGGVSRAPPHACRPRRPSEPAAALRLGRQRGRGRHRGRRALQLELRTALSGMLSTFCSACARAVPPSEHDVANV